MNIARMFWWLSWIPVESCYHNPYCFSISKPCVLNTASLCLPAQTWDPFNRIYIRLHPKFFIQPVKSGLEALKRTCRAGELPQLAWMCRMKLKLLTCSPLWKAKEHRSIRGFVPYSNKTIQTPCSLVYLILMALYHAKKDADQQSLLEERLGWVLWGKRTGMLLLINFFLDFLFVCLFVVLFRFNTARLMRMFGILVLF